MESLGISCAPLAGSYSVSAICTSFGMSISTGPGRPLDADVKRLADNVGQLIHPRDQIVVLGDGHRHAGNIRFLKGIRAHQTLRHVAR